MKSADVFLIDASIYVFRSYFSMPDEFRANDGLAVNAVYGFARFVGKFLRQTQASEIAFAFDESLDGSFRNEIYPPYKANREPAPEELKKQFVLCRRLTEGLGIATYSDKSYEADDLIGTLAKSAQDQGKTICVVSADKDLAQLITDKDTWWSYGKSEPFDSTKVFEKFGVRPTQIADYLALTGDAVDNIPGVSGVGPKIAAYLLNHFGDLETLLNRHKEIAHLSLRGAKSIQKKIQSGLEEAKLAKQLTKIVTDVPVDSLDMARKATNPEKLTKLFDYMNFGPILRRMLLES